MREGYLKLKYYIITRKTRYSLLCPWATKKIKACFMSQKQKTDSIEVTVLSACNPSQFILLLGKSKF